MPTIKFQPANITIEAEMGENILKAANHAGITTELPCGGRGVCGKCLVKATGRVSVRTGGREAILEDSPVPICKAYALDTPLEIEILTAQGGERGKFSEIARDLGLIDPELLPSEEELGPLIKKITVTVPQPQMGDGLSDLDRLNSSLGMRHSGVPLSLLKNLPQTLREEYGTVTVAYYENQGIAHIVDIRPGEGLTDYAAVIDIGTTTVAAALVELKSGEIMASKTEYNGQLTCGLDIISRINYAQKPERREELRTRALDTINLLIGQLTAMAGISLNEVRSASIAANTTMVHLLLGIDPEWIRLEPYTPAVYRLAPLRAGDVGLSICREAAVSIAASVGSYVGGDITAGLLCTSLATDSEELALFIDIGTNGEIVVGNNEFLLGCACSAGPAFEGGGIAHGMRASQGAIERVEITDGKIICHTIGNAPAKGICGSGMISLAAELFRSGYLDAGGKLSRERPEVTIAGKTVSIKIAETESGGAITISEADIDNLIRAKAAIFSACCVMLESVGMGFEDISRIYIAGGFGRYLDIANAKTIGLLPNLPDEKFKFLGNSSACGAYMCALSESRRELTERLAGRITYLDLSTEAGYMHQYTAALFLPHTDTRYFV